MEKFEDFKLFLSKYKYWFMIGGIACCLLFGISIYYINVSVNHDKNKVIEKTNNDEKLLDILKEEEKEKACQIMVDIKGEIEKPGIYQLECEKRVQDVINLAGGLTKKADVSVLNLSKKIVDEMVIIIYSKEQVDNFIITKEEEIKKQESCQTSLEIKNDACICENEVLDTDIVENEITGDEIIGDTPVNNSISLNKASKEELMTLSGIGESKADSIILYRNENGGFKSIEEIKNVKGIGDSIFEKIKNNITI